MVRVAKNPAKRKQELIDAAERLFLEKGYERTSISDIVNEVKVAQGTFYYHFKSKADVLEGIVERIIMELEQELWALARREDLDAPSVLNEMINSILRFHKGKEELVDCAHRRENAILHQELEESSHARLIPPLTEVVARGTAERYFGVPYARETAEILYEAVITQIHQPGLLSDSDRCKRSRVALEHILAKVLGTSDHEFRLEL
jgi:AcrR family transcriptional regulator